MNLPKGSYMGNIGLYRDMEKKMENTVQSLGFRVCHFGSAMVFLCGVIVYYPKETA